MGLFLGRLFGRKKQENKFDSEKIYGMVFENEKNSNYKMIISQAEPYYDYLMENKDVFISNIYCFPSIIDEIYYSMSGYLDQHPELNDSKDVYITKILIIYQRALYAMSNADSAYEGRFMEVTALIEQLACSNAETKVTESDFTCNILGNRGKCPGLLKTALMVTHMRGEYGIAGIYRRLGDLFGSDALDVHREFAGAFYGLSIFFGDDSIQNMCRKNAQSHSISIMNTREAVSLLRAHNIQVGYSREIYFCANQIRESYGDKIKGNLKLSIQDIMTSTMLIDAM